MEENIVQYYSNNDHNLPALDEDGILSDTEIIEHDYLPIGESLAQTFGSLIDPYPRHESAKIDPC